MKAVLFGLPVTGDSHHTDGEREFAYDAKAPWGTLVDALKEAPRGGWTVVSIVTHPETRLPHWGRRAPFSLTLALGAPLHTSDPAVVFSGHVLARRLPYPQHGSEA